LIGQKLIIPDKKLAAKLGEQGLKKVIRNICDNRANHEKNSQHNTQVHRLRQRQSNNEQIAHTPAKKVQPPFFEFDLGKIPIREVKSGMFRIVMRANGTLLLHSSEASPAITVQGLDSLKGSAKYFAENAAGKLFSETTLDFNAKTKTVKLSNKFTTQSNLPNHPSVSLAFETNAQGKPALVGSMTQDLVKGKIDSHTFVGEKIGIEIEVTWEKGVLLEDKVVVVNASEGATKSKPVTPEDTVWIQLAATVGMVALTVGAVALTAATVAEDFVPVAGGVLNDPASF
ncbi:MAG: hypothetical protein GXP14_02390, partial [Gammaproteobacteria bacterium]|nr:hypothetical protein [Gammaproteobacteria bacterium]